MKNERVPQRFANVAKRARGNAADPVGHDAKGSPFGPLNATPHFLVRADYDKFLLRSISKSILFIQSLHHAPLQTFFHGGILLLRCVMRNLSVKTLCLGLDRMQPAEAERVKVGLSPITNHASRLRNHCISNRHSAD
jgi:hypothetical protein